jgi:hypothetical protein
MHPPSFTVVTLLTAFLGRAWVIVGSRRRSDPHVRPGFFATIRAFTFCFGSVRMLDSGYDSIQWMQSKSWSVSLG